VSRACLGFLLVFIYAEVSKKEGCVWVSFPLHSVEGRIEGTIYGCTGVAPNRMCLHCVTQEAWVRANLYLLGNITAKYKVRYKNTALFANNRCRFLT
jgi:hypothetical protein